MMCGRDGHLVYQRRNLETGKSARDDAVGGCGTCERARLLRLLSPEQQMDSNITYFTIHRWKTIGIIYHKL